MIIKDKIKILLSIFLFLSLFIMFHMFEPSGIAYGEPIKVDTYYVGGAGASNENSGFSSIEPLATISHATSMINSQGEGSYKIIVQGEIVENKTVRIGDGINPIRMAITNAATGSAIVVRGAGLSGDFIVVEDNAALTLGDETVSTEEAFILNGNNYEMHGCAITVNPAANLEIYSNAVLQSFINKSSAGFGGVIYNLGTVSLMGGTLENNSSYFGGAIYNKGTLLLNDGHISRNTAQQGGGIYNIGAIYMTGGTVDSNNASEGGGIYNTGDLFIEGGAISDNRGAIYSLGTISLADDASIPWDELNNYINLNHEINIPNQLNGADKISLMSNAYILGQPVLTGSAEVLAFCYTRFELSDNRYGIDRTGKLIYGEAITYFVGGVNADNGNEGTDPEFPLASLEVAVSKANEQTRSCIITLQADIAVNNSIFINNDITIQSDVIARKITPTREGSILDSPFNVESGTLTLGGGEAENSLLFWDFTWTGVPFFTNGRSGTLILKEGLTVSNIKMSSFVINEGTLIIEGGSYQNNDFNYFAKNLGTITMTGGNISFNHWLDNEENATVFENRNTTNIANLHIEGGSILNNQMSGVVNQGSLTFTGGVIADNPIDIQILGIGDFTIYGGAQVSSIYLQNTSNVIQIEGDLAVKTITVILDGYSIGRDILRGMPTILEANNKKFVLEDPNYRITEIGKLEFSGTASSVYYVGGTGANDVNTGITKEVPFASLENAVRVIGSNTATIILQSDITLADTISIIGNITITSDGTVRTIFRGHEVAAAMFRVSGKLILGNSDYSGSDSSPELILDGNGSMGVEANGPVIENTGDLYLYPGTILQNNINVSPYSTNSYSGILNLGGTLYMYGGVIQNNTSQASAILNVNKARFIMKNGSIKNNKGTDSSGVSVIYSSFLMEGGSINNNLGLYSSGVVIDMQSEFTMRGGTISGNNDGKEVIWMKKMVSINGAGVNIANGSTFTMEGGTISNNSHANTAGVIISDSSFTMAEGNIIDNTGSYYAGVILNSMNGESIDSYFTMNEGNISGNKGEFSGIYANYSNITINGGTISNNIGSGSGIMVDNSNIFMNGGVICGNVAETLAGIGFNVMGGKDMREPIYEIFHMNGGVIQDNKALIHGIATLNKIQMSGSAVITGGDKLVFLLFPPESGIEFETGIELTSEVPSSSQDIMIALYYAGKDITPVTEFPIGRQLVSFGNGYHFTWEDTSKFKLVSEEYAINSDGRIGTALQDDWVTISEASGTYYDKGEKTVAITVQDSQRTLTLNKDYSVLYQNNINAGTAQIILLGRGNYAGTIFREFNIHPIELSEGWVNIEDSSKIYYDGKEKTVEITVFDGSVELIKDSDYTVAYRNNTQVGDAEVTITGIGNYEGTIIKEFTIYKRPAPPIYIPPYVPDIPQKEEEQKETEPVAVVVKEGRLTIDINKIPEDEIEENKEEINLTIPSKEFLEYIAKDEVTDVNIRVIAEALLSGESSKRNLLLKEDVLETAKDSEKDLTVTVEDQEGRERFTWYFPSNEMKSSHKDIIDVNLNLEVYETEFTEERTASSELHNNGLIIDFHHEGELPSQAGIKIYVGDKKDIKPGSRVYLYHINQDTGLLETLPFSSNYKVDDEGYIYINILHCSDYAVFTKEASDDLISSLRDQISVATDKNILYAGGDVDASAQITVILPPTLETVESFQKKTSQSAIGGVTITYRSSNEKVASVDKEGRITAKKKGSTTIYVKITIYNGKSKVVMLKINVKEPYIQLTRFKDTLDFGSVYRFRAVAYGLDIKDLVWTTKRKSKIIINKNTGVAVTRSKGTDYVVATINNVSKEVKVVVK